MNVLPENSGGDTLFASAYEAYDRLSSPMQTLLESCTATHSGQVFRNQARNYGFELHTEPRGCPEDVGDVLEANHPCVRTNPITGWKALFVNKS